MDKQTFEEFIHAKSALLFSPACSWYFTLIFWMVQVSFTTFLGKVLVILMRY